MFVAFLIVLCLILLVSIAIAWRVRSRPKKGADDVIYLGYDDQDNVGSMRSAMLDRLKRGDLEPR